MNRRQFMKVAPVALATLPFARPTTPGGVSAAYIDAVVRQVASERIAHKRLLPAVIGTVRVHHPMLASPVEITSERELVSLDIQPGPFSLALDRSAA